MITIRESLPASLQNFSEKSDNNLMTKVYLDTSVYNRPFDDQTQPKVHLGPFPGKNIPPFIDGSSYAALVLPFKRWYILSWKSPRNTGSNCYLTNG